MAEPEPESEHREAVAGFLTSHEGWLKSVIVARLGSSSGVEDVLQDVSVAAIEQKSPLKSPNAVTAWLYQIAVHQVLQFRRRAGRYRKRVAQAAEAEAVKHDSACDPLAWLLATERQQLVRRALQQVNGEDRELLMLKYVEGWSYRKIAQNTGRTERSVESQVHRARARLRARLVQLNVAEEASEE